mgnify:FL=1
MVETVTAEFPAAGGSVAASYGVAQRAAADHLLDLLRDLRQHAQLQRSSFGSDVARQSRHVTPFREYPRSSCGSRHLTPFSGRLLDAHSPRSGAMRSTGVPRSDQNVREEMSNRKLKFLNDTFFLADGRQIFLLATEIEGCRFLDS